VVVVEKSTWWWLFHSIQIQRWSTLLVTVVWLMPSSTGGDGPLPVLVAVPLFIADSEVKADIHPLVKLIIKVGAKGNK
jgi:hypothetical protein